MAITDNQGQQEDLPVAGCRLPVAGCRLQIPLLLLLGSPWLGDYESTLYSIFYSHEL